LDYEIFFSPSPLLPFSSSEEKGPGDEEVGAGYEIACPRDFLQPPPPLFDAL